MAKRTRKQKQRAVARRPSASQPMTSGAPGAPSAVAPTPRPIAPVAAGEDAELEVAAAQDTPVQDLAASVAVQIPASESGRRRVERVATAGAPVARPRTTRGQTQGYIAALESEDAAIPFDRVPYVPSDLRRVAIIAALMIALIIVADIIVSNVVK
jgi:hypothetical protein